MIQNGDANMRFSCLIVIILALACTLLLPTGCQQQAEVAQGPKPAPKITFESLEYDFGTVGPKRKLLGEFKFTNTGDAPLEITKVEKCCGVVTKLDKTDYAPGESGVLKVEYRSSSMASTMKKRLYVNSNDGANPRATLTIQAKIELRVTWEPRSLKLLLKDENAGCPEITIKSTDNQPFSITKFQSTADWITADIDSSVEATKFVLQPRVDLEKIQKRRGGRIIISLAFSEPNAATETASIMFQALSRFSVRPSVLVVLFGEQRKPTKKILRITNNYGEDFEIESTSSEEGRIEILEQKKIGTAYQLELQISPPPGDNIKRFTDNLTINMKDGEKLNVSCQGIYSIRKPRITASGK
jgi:hypothetical protein